MPHNREPSNIVNNSRARFFLKINMPCFLNGVRPLQNYPETFGSFPHLSYEMVISEVIRSIHEKSWENHHK